jgi:hypothetical protein
VTGEINFREWKMLVGNNVYARIFVKSSAAEKKGLYRLQWLNMKQELLS